MLLKFFKDLFTKKPVSQVKSGGRTAKIPSGENKLFDVSAGTAIVSIVANLKNIISDCRL